MGQHRRKDHRPSRLHLQRNCIAVIQSAFHNLTVNCMYVFECLALMSAGQHMHATILYRCIVQRNPRRSNRFQRQPVKIGIVLMPGLFRSDKRRLGKSHLVFQNNLLPQNARHKTLDTRMFHQVLETWDAPDDTRATCEI